jgi:hypothetical protein
VATGFNQIWSSSSQYFLTEVAYRPMAVPMRGEPTALVINIVRHHAVGCEPRGAMLPGRLYIIDLFQDRMRPEPVNAIPRNVGLGDRLFEILSVKPNWSGWNFSERLPTPARLCALLQN